MTSLLVKTDDSAVHVISSLPQLRALEKEWHALARRSKSPLTQFEWFISAAEAFARSDQLFVVIVRRDHRLVAMAPLVLTRGTIGKALKVLGHQLGEPQQLVFDDEDALKTLMRALTKVPYPLVIRKVLADGPESACFSTLPSRGLKFVTGADDQTSLVPLSHALKPVEKRGSKKRRASLRRSRSLAEAQGSLAFQFLAPPPEELDALLDEVFHVEASGWKGRAGTSVTANGELETFFRAYCRRAAQLGILRLGFMKIGDATAAVRVDVAWDRRTWELKIGYDERFAACSPGLLLGHEALLLAQAQGLEGHHFLGQYEQWHDYWAAEQQARLTLRHYPLSAASGVALVQDALPRLRAALGLKVGQRD